MEVKIERILPGGLGLGHAEGRTVMVPLSAPGDRLRVEIERVKGNVSFGRIMEVVEASSDRVEPPCPYFGRCGGCDFQQLNYQAQLNAKVEIIKDCLRRVGGFQTVPDFKIIPAANVWHYRSRAQWQYDSINRRLGYFEGNSRRVCDVAECAVLAPELQESLESFRQRTRDGSLPDDVKDIRAISGDEVVSIAVTRFRNAKLRESPDSERSRDVTHLIGAETYSVNAEAFFQTNYDLLPALLDYALKDASGSLSIDLYCGVGLFTLPMARKFQYAIGVEADVVAAKFARANLTRAGVSNAEIANEDVAGWLEENLKLGRPDFLLLDPPRSGGESRVIAGIVKLSPQNVCYVSCDPATLARDLKKLSHSGYAIDSLAAFDMFPQTHHVETVVHLKG